MSKTENTGRLTNVRTWLARAKLDGLIVPRTDAHQSEVTAAHDDCLEYISGFTGSAGMAFVQQEQALIFVDGRYQVQVRNEVDLSAFAVHHLHDDPLDLWLSHHGKPGWRIGIHTLLISGALYEKLLAGCKAAGVELITLDADPFDEIWIDRPPRPVGLIRAMPPAVSGETSASKRDRIAGRLKALGADQLVETSPDNIAWLLNVRGSDVAMDPVPHSFLLLDADNRAQWFVDHRKLGNDRAEFELSDVTIADPEDFLGAVGKASAGKTTLIDPDFAPQAVRARIKAAGGQTIEQTSLLASAKATKNATELEGFRACHIEDGIALTNFLAWLDREWHRRQASELLLTELDAEEQLIAFRAKHAGYFEPSFRTISAAGGNAAMCHYHAQPDTNAAIEENSFYLIDSGGQYANGTTDVTRTVLFGEASDEMREAYTAVLKGFIALVTARFPLGTQGHQLDALARRPLWDMGLDYDHGTGHGVGHNLLIHEYPHRFAKKPNPHNLEPGTIMTVEPGYYKAGAFGIRIENQVEVVADKPGFCRFDSLTLAPIDLRMAKLDSLTAAEIDFLDTYHAQVRSQLSEKVDPETRPYLLRHTQPIAQRHQANER
ncbi:aminopeptidase P family protein [Rhizobium lusitanum]|nr:aminopeptidase P family protein [Rhizobium lusitanum]